MVDYGPLEATRIAQHLAADLPPGLFSLTRLQWSEPHVRHRYLLAESGTSLYVVCMGTKLRRDLVTNAAVSLAPLSSASSAAQSEPGPASTGNVGLSLFVLGEALL